MAGLKIICGTSSKWRQKVLQNAGFDCRVMTADIDEKAIRHADPKIMPVLIAKAKAEAILKKLKEEDRSSRLVLMVRVDIISLGSFD